MPKELAICRFVKRVGAESVIAGHPIFSVRPMAKNFLRRLSAKLVWPCINFNWVKIQSLTRSMVSSRWR